jgi:hypothetical protein
MRKESLLCIVCIKRGLEMLVEGGLKSLCLTIPPADLSVHLLTPYSNVLLHLLHISRT